MGILEAIRLAWTSQASWPIRCTSLRGWEQKTGGFLWIWRVAVEGVKCGQGTTEERGEHPIGNWLEALCIWVQTCISLGSFCLKLTLVDDSFRFPASSIHVEKKLAGALSVGRTVRRFGQDWPSSQVCYW